MHDYIIKFSDARGRSVASVEFKADAREAAARIGALSSIPMQIDINVDGSCLGRISSALSPQVL